MAVPTANEGLPIGKMVNRVSSSLRAAQQVAAPKTPLNVGDLVLVVDKQLLPTKWPLGRIHETNVGGDGVVHRENHAG